ATKIVLGRAQLAAGEVTAARMAFSAALDAPKLRPWDRARAHYELSRAASSQGDAQGAAAQAAAAFEAALTAAQKETLDLGLSEAIAAAVVANGRAADAMASLDTVRGQPGYDVSIALVLAARQAAGDAGVTDTMVDDALADALRSGASSA